MKSVWNPYEICRISWNPYEICQISWNPYEIWRISGEIHPNWRVFAETSEFIRFWVDFTWNLADFRWNPPKLKSFCWNIWIDKVLGGFHGEICWISWNLPDFRWNPLDFMVKSTGFQIMSFCVMIKYRSFDFQKTNQMSQQKLFWLVSWKMKDLYLIITQKLIILKSSGFHADFMWNPVDFMKSLVIAPTLHSSNWRVFAETLAFIILGGFHRWNLGELCWISQVKSLVIAPTLHSSNWRVFAETLAFIILGGFHRWNLGKIHQISWLKSTRFQGEIHQISRVKSPTLHSSNWRVFAKTLAFIILGGFHRWNRGEICQISWLKSTRFQGEIHWISRVKSPTLHSSNWRVFAETLVLIILGGFHRWYLGEIHWISQVKSARFQGEIWWISWNPWS